mmetsp:Transcript_62061/g.134675  ORF Transcript_62061/g.134675 Transcript_62061/m.134675 type:complete len:132 (+) Transcript_62061:1097-1492(+)
MHVAHLHTVQRGLRWPELHWRGPHGCHPSPGAAGRIPEAAGKQESIEKPEFKKDFKSQATHLKGRAPVSCLPAAFLWPFGKPDPPCSKMKCSDFQAIRILLLSALFLNAEKGSIAGNHFSAKPRRSIRPSS